MTEERFEELINLYLDNEIGRHELGELKHAIKDNLVRRRKFERACQLHQAASKALSNRDFGQEKSGSAGSGGSSRGERTDTRPSSRSAASAGAGSLKHRQSQAHRNVSVATLAERQLNKGAASSLDISSIGGSDEDAGSSTSARAPVESAAPFFNSGLGVIAGGILAFLGILGVIFALTHNDTSKSDPDADAPPDIHLRADSPELQAVVRRVEANEQGQPDSTALSSDFASRWHQMNYSSSTIGQPGNQTVSTYLHIAQGILVGPVTIEMDEANASQLGLGWPGNATTSGNLDAPPPGPGASPSSGNASQTPVMPLLP